MFFSVSLQTLPFHFTVFRIPRISHVTFTMNPCVSINSQIQLAGSQQQQLPVDYLIFDEHYICTTYPSECESVWMSGSWESREKHTIGLFQRPCFKLAAHLLGVKLSCCYRGTVFLSPQVIGMLPGNNGQAPYVTCGAKVIPFCLSQRKPQSVFVTVPLDVGPLRLIPLEHAPYRSSPFPFMSMF